MFRAPTASGGGGGVPLTSITTQSPNPTDMGDQSHHRAAAARAFQFHPARPAIIDLFNLYLGVRYFFYIHTKFNEPYALLIANDDVHYNGIINFLLFFDMLTSPYNVFSFCYSINF